MKCRIIIEWILLVIGASLSGLALSSLTIYGTGVLTLSIGALLLIASWVLYYLRRVNEVD